MLQRFCKTPYIFRGLWPEIATMATKMMMDERTIELNIANNDDVISTPQYYNLLERKPHCAEEEGELYTSIT